MPTKRKVPAARKSANKPATPKEEVVIEEQETIVQENIESEEEIKEIVNVPYIPKEEVKVEEPKKEGKGVPSSFEFKDRSYSIKGEDEPVAYYFKRKFLWYDPIKGYEREVLFTDNQKTPFVDEFKGAVIPARPALRGGVLRVPKEKRVWQYILSELHPHLGKRYVELDSRKDAIDELEEMNTEFEAMKLAMEMDISKAESIVRANVGSVVSKMSSFEIMRDLRVMAKQDPQLLIDLANDDNIELRNIAAKAVEQSVLKISADRRTVTWGANGRKLFSVPFEEHPLIAITSWFKTNEGLDLLPQIERKIA